MKDYIERVLHRGVTATPYDGVRFLPLAIRNAYEVERMNINGTDALVARPRFRFPLAELRKHHRQMEACTQLPCVLYLTDMNYYARDVMLEEGIPFVWEGHQIYLPFAGALIDDYHRTVANCPRISYLTQKLLLTALYQDWRDVTVTKAAEMLEVSKTSITRCFDELEAIGNPYLTLRRRARSITVDKDRRATWEAIRRDLRTPVITTYALKNMPNAVLPISGMTALAHYSLLDEGTYPVLAMTKKDLARVMVTASNLAPAGEVPGCVVQEMGYWIRFNDGSVVDPLTVALSFSGEEQADPRIGAAIDEMLERYVW